MIFGCSFKPQIIHTPGRSWFKVVRESREGAKHYGDCMEAFQTQRLKAQEKKMVENTSGDILKVYIESLIT